jgi:hypothetical protein
MEQQKKRIEMEYYKKPWTDNKGDFNRVRYQAYKSHNRLITTLSRKSYGIILDGNILTIKKVIGGIMINGQRAKLKKVSINFNKIKQMPLQEQLNYIDNLLNSD